MDVCCLNRPFDDLSQDRVYLEAEAVLTIIARCERGEWTLAGSGLIELELSKISDQERLDQVMTLYEAAQESLNLTAPAEQRAAFFQINRLKQYDSLHLAIAEDNGVDAFLTTDVRLLKAAGKLDLAIQAVNPVSWLLDVTENER